jgi:hypothetical protein
MGCIWLATKYRVGIMDGNGAEEMSNWRKRGGFVQVFGFAGLNFEFSAFILLRVLMLRQNGEP